MPTCDRWNKVRVDGVNRGTEINWSKPWTLNRSWTLNHSISGKPHPLSLYLSYGPQTDTQRHNNICIRTHIHTGVRHHLWYACISLSVYLSVYKHIYIYIETHVHNHTCTCTFLPTKPFFISLLSSCFFPILNLHHHSCHLHTITTLPSLYDGGGGSPRTKRDKHDSN